MFKDTLNFEGCSIQFVSRFVTSLEPAVTANQQAYLLHLGSRDCIAVARASAITTSSA